MAYTCPDCGTTATPGAVDKDTVLGYWAVTCADCGTTTLTQTAFSDCDVEEHRTEVA